MSVENEGQAPTTPANPAGQAPTNTTPNPAQTPAAQAVAPKVEELHPEIQKLIKELRSENASHRTKANEAEQKAQADKEAQLKEQNDWKTLAEKKEKELADMKAEFAKREFETMRTKVATDAKLPVDLASRLVGTTEEELKADAEKLAKLIPTAGVSNTGAGARTPAQAVAGGNARNPRPAPLSGGAPNFGVIRPRV